MKINFTTTIKVGTEYSVLNKEVEYNPTYDDLLEFVEENSYTNIVDYIEAFTEDFDSIAAKVFDEVEKAEQGKDNQLVSILCNDVGAETELSDFLANKLQYSFDNCILEAILNNRFKISLDK